MLILVSSRKFVHQNPNFTKTLRSSLKKEPVAELWSASFEGLNTSRESSADMSFRSTVSHSTSPTVPHFPPRAMHPSKDPNFIEKEDEDDDVTASQEIERPSFEPHIKITGTAPESSSGTKFDWSTYDGTNAPADSKVLR